MPDVFRIKRRTSGGAGAPVTLANAELAYNEVNDILYYGKGDNAGQATSIIPIAGAGYSSGGITVGDTPPASPVAGTGWFDTNTTDGGQLYIWFIDPTGPGQWVPATNQSGSFAGASAGGDLGSTFPNPVVIATHLTAPLPVAQGGTNAATAPAALISLGAFPQTGGVLAGNLQINGGTLPSPLQPGSILFNPAGAGCVIASTTGGLNLTCNQYYDGTNWRATTTGVTSNLNIGGNATWTWFNSASTTAGAIPTSVQRMYLNTTGTLTLNSTGTGFAAGFVATLSATGAIDLSGLQINTPTSSDCFINLNGNHMYGVGVKNNGNFYIYDYTGGGLRLGIDTTGIVTLSSSLLVRPSGSIGGVGLRQGDSTHAGYLEIISASGTRLGYIGFDNGNPCIVSDTGTWISYNHFAPVGDNGTYCGFGGHAWASVASYAWATQSDRRHKTDIEDLPSNCLDLVASLKPQRFKFNNGPVEDRDKTHWGFIAQDVAAVMTKAGHDFGGHVVQNGEEAINYNELVACLWRAVQELSAEVRALKAGT
jgi:hypothetical protein